MYTKNAPTDSDIITALIHPLIKPDDEILRKGVDILKQISINKDTHSFAFSWMAKDIFNFLQMQKQLTDDKNKLIDDNVVESLLGIYQRPDVCFKIACNKLQEVAAISSSSLLANAANAVLTHVTSPNASITPTLINFIESAAELVREPNGQHGIVNDVLISNLDNHIINTEALLNENHTEMKDLIAPAIPYLLAVFAFTALIAATVLTFGAATPFAIGMLTITAGLLVTAAALGASHINDLSKGETVLKGEAVTRYAKAEIAKLKLETENAKEDLSKMQYNQ